MQSKRFAQTSPGANLTQTTGGAVDKAYDNNSCSSSLGQMRTAMDVGDVLCVVC